MGCPSIIAFCVLFLENLLHFKCSLCIYMPKQDYKTQLLFLWSLTNFGRFLVKLYLIKYFFKESTSMGQQLVILSKISFSFETYCYTTMLCPGNGWASWLYYTTMWCEVLQILNQSVDNLFVSRANWYIFWFIQEAMVKCIMA